MFLVQLRDDLRRLIDSKYAYLGALRSAAQMISYEISIGFTALTVVICSGSFSLSTIILAQQKVWYILPLLPIFIIFYVSMLAETNRHPFDLPEAEAELYERTYLLLSQTKLFFLENRWVEETFFETFKESIMCVLARINSLFRFVYRVRI
jgi:NADH:ubiquinone oxidoreductase subunit H